MASSDKKTIVVIGATGNQGSSVAHTFLESPNWNVRCVTRNPSSPASQSLLTLGAEIVQADLSDISSLHSAFADAHAIFLNTDFWEKYRATLREEGTDSSQVAFDQEVLHGKNAAMAATNVATLENFIYSALPPAKKHSQGKYPHSYHLNSKASIVEYIETEQPELAKKMSLIYLGCYITNQMLTPRFDAASGAYKFVLPMKKETRMPIVDPQASTGLFVQVLVESEAAGTKLLAYDSHLSLGEITDIWSRASGKTAVFMEVSIEEMHRQFGIPIEVLDGAGYINEFGYTGGIVGISEPGELRGKVKTKSFEERLRERDWKKILEVN